MNAVYESYLSVMYNGYKPCFVTETHINDINNYKVFVVPEAMHTSKENIEKIIAYAKNGGKVILLGENCLKYDLNNAEHSQELINELYSLSDVIPTGTESGAIRMAIGSKVNEILAPKFDEVLKPNYKLVDAETGEKVKDTEWLVTEYNGSIIVNIMNYDWESSKKVKLIANDKEFTQRYDLVSGEEVGEIIELEPYTPTLIKFN